MPQPQDERSVQRGHSTYEKILQESLRSELRAVNAGLPRSPKRLSELLTEQYPHVVCHDGAAHSFKRSELEYLAGTLDTAEQEELELPMLIELGANEAEAYIICGGQVEEKIISRVLNMPVTCERRRIRVYRPQVALLRRKLRTTTVYVFSHRLATC